MKLSTKISRALTLRNIKIGATILLALATSFGFIAPETATKLRNDVLVPLEIVSAGTGDL